MAQEDKPLPEINHPELRKAVLEMQLKKAEATN